MHMKFLNWLWLNLFSERGEGEGEGQGGSAEGSAEGQGGQDGVAEGQGKPAVDVEALTRERDELKSKHDTLSGQSRATERNLAATREALKANGLQLAQDSDGNMRVMPIVQSRQGSRFTDEHKNKFFSYFPDSKSGEEFLNIVNLLLDDRLERGFKDYDGTLTKRQQYQSVQAESNGRMLSLWPSLNPEAKDSFNKAFYDKATEIWEKNYRNLPNGELIAANEAAVEMGIAPAAVVTAEKQGFQKGKESRKIVGNAQGSQGQSGGGGFKKLSFAEYSKLASDARSEYDKNEIESRKG